MEQKIDIFFSEKISLIILLLVSTLTIVLASQIYTYEKALLLQDAVNYISLAENPRDYFTVPHQDALRILPSIIIYFLKFSGISTENCFKYLELIKRLIIKEKLQQLLIS